MPRRVPTELNIIAAGKVYSTEYTYFQNAELLSSIMIRI
jgi:hypothetical protein